MNRKAAITECIAALKKQAVADGVDLSAELDEIGKKVGRFVNPRDAWDLVRRARDPERLRASEVIAGVFDEFTELHGDRLYGDDGAIIGGVAFLGGIPVTVIASQKGANLKETMALNAGMASPEGYRKALRLAHQAEKFGRPIVTFVDTQGAYPGLGSEERGIGESIAMNLREFTHLRTPIVCVVIGEGGSGGALGICVGDRVFMLEHSYFSVITPEAFASLVLHDPSKKEKAARMMGITPADMVRSGFCDGIIGEVENGRSVSHQVVCERIKALLAEELARLSAMDIDQLIEIRNKRYFSF